MQRRNLLVAGPGGKKKREIYQLRVEGKGKGITTNFAR